MTARLVLHLSGAWTRDQDALLKDGDILYRMPGLSTVSFRNGWLELPRSPQGDIQALLDQYMGLFAGLEDQLSSLPFTSLVNDQFIYSVIPVASALSEISKIIERSQPREILMFHSAMRSLRVPATGIVTLESSHGSRDVLGTIVAESVKAGISDIPIVLHRLRGDALSRAWLRRGALRIGSSLILLHFVIKMLRTGLRRHAGQDQKSFRGLVLVRSVEHARHAARIFSGKEGVCALVTPQFTQGNSEQIRSYLEGHLPSYVPGISSLVRSLLVALSPSSLFRQNQIQRINCGPFSFTTSLKDLEKDFNAVHFYSFQKELLRQALRAFPSARFTAGFEIQGAFAWIEGSVPRSAGLISRTVQPALVQKRPLPVFPFSDCFLADSAPNQNDLADIGFLRFGEVDFQGPPFEVRSLKEPSVPMVIGYFSQPYEIENNGRIVETLCNVAASRGWKVFLRLHPRDKSDQFDKVLKEYPEICSITKPEPLEEFLDKIDVSVTRTSSVTKEAIARGCQCVNVLPSNLDQITHADYIRVADQYLPHVATDLEKMVALVCDPVQLREASQQLQSRLFKERGFPEFVEYISR